MPRFALRLPFVVSATLATLLMPPGPTHGDDRFDSRPQPWRRLERPILSAHNTQQAWCKVVLYSPHVLFHDGKFRMWYLGTSTASRSNDIALGYAESDDGIRWAEHPNNPLLTSKDVSWGEFWQTPFVLFDAEESLFKMWFTSGPGVRRDARRKIVLNDQRLGYATSRDGLKWQIRQQPIYASGRGPCVIKEASNRYRMWMNSRPDMNDRVSSDLYANIYAFHSTDGIHWSRAKQPAIRPSGRGRTAIYPFVIREREQYRMWYGCHTPGRFEIFHAVSRDGQVWKVDHQRPAFPARPVKGYFDSRYTSTPCVVRRPDRDLLYYSARDLKDAYVDGQGRKRKDGAGVYAHIGVALLPRR